MRPTNLWSSPWLQVSSNFSIHHSATAYSPFTLHTASLILLVTPKGSDRRLQELKSSVPMAPPLDDRITAQVMLARSQTQVRQLHVDSNLENASETSLRASMTHPRRQNESAKPRFNVLHAPYREDGARSDCPGGEASARRRGRLPQAPGRGLRDAIHPV